MLSKALYFAALLSFYIRHLISQPAERPHPLSDVNKQDCYIFKRLFLTYPKTSFIQFREKLKQKLL